MKTIITGALGHIGSRLCRDWQAAFPAGEIIMFDNLFTQRYASLFNLPAQGHYRFIEGDVLKDDMAAILEGADVVIHLAAITDAASSFNAPQQVEQVNLVGTTRVAQACAQTGAKFILLSTTSVYGTQAAMVDEDCTLAELKPQSPYAESKLKAEEMLHVLGVKKGLNYVICRFGTICGVSIGMRFHTAVNKFCWQAVMGLPITIWSTALNQKRPYLSLSDASRALQFIVKHQIFDQRVYNILTDNLTPQDILNLIQTHIPMIKIQYTDSQIMNQLSYEVSNLRFTGLGFTFQGSIAQDIAETIQWLNAAGGKSDR